MITEKSFGTLNDGRTAKLFTLTNASGASLSLSDYGARIVSIMVPDREGKLGEVCLGFPDANAYTTAGTTYIGAAIGRVGNRIGGAAFKLNDVCYPVPANENGNCLHGGLRGFDAHWWETTTQEGDEADVVTFRRISPDGEEGFPGTLEVEINYAWTAKNELCITYHAVGDKDTVCAMTNHAYFNLDGAETVSNHVLQLNATLITETDLDLIPTGEERAVDGLPVDFRTPMLLADGLARREEYPIMVEKNGYDSNFFVPGEGMRLMAVLSAPATGRVMHVCSTEPCIQFYSGQGLSATGGHGGRNYGGMSGLALETQHHPDAVNHANFPSVVLRKGEAYHSETVYSFSVNG